MTLTSAEDDCPGAVGHDAVFEVPLDGAREHEALDVAADPHEICTGVAVTPAGDILLDDRPLVELCRDVVRRRADHLDPSLERPVVGARACEGGKERMVDVD